MPKSSRRMAVSSFQGVSRMKPSITYSGANVTNASITWTSWTTRVRHAYTDGWWGVADALGHMLRLPRWLQRPICDRFEIAVGVPKADLIEMDYTRLGKRTPWWLR